MSSSRGFTLIELLIAGTIALGLVAGAFILLTEVQRTSASQAQAAENTSAARVAMEMMARDLRGAGDFLDLLPAPCLGDKGHLPTDVLCPALLDAHPWRIAIARNSWIDADGDGSVWGEADTMPPLTRLFTAEPQNVVVYRFVPDGNGKPKEMKGGVGGKRNGLLGRIERVVNPFSFNGEEPLVSVILDRVLLDDRMRTSPTDSAKADPRYDHSLFMYRVATQDGELDGALGKRSTSLDGYFLTPPLRFFKHEEPADYAKDPPWIPKDDYDKEIVGLEADEKVVNKLLLAGTGNLSPTDPTSDFRMLLDRNRIRAVRIAFKVVDPRERPEVRDGLDLDGDPKNGTARVHAFETTVELKVLANRVGVL